MSYTERLKQALHDYAEDNCLSYDDAVDFLKTDMGELAVRGYEIFTSPDVQALHIERIDELGVFDSDIEAARQAKKDGIKLIPLNEQPHKYPFNNYRFIDTPENRLQLFKAAREY